MKLKSLLFISMAILGLTLLAIALSMLVTVREAERLDEQEAHAAEIARDANDLGYLASDYLLFPGERQRRRWESEYAAAGQHVNGLEPADERQQAIVDSIRTGLKRSGTVFQGISRTVESSGSIEQQSPESIRVSWSRMAVQNQGVSIDAVRLSESLRSRKAYFDRRNFALIVALLGVLGVYLVGTYTLVYRRALGSIAELQAGTRVVGSGDLDYRIPVARDDEVGRLARAFNRMTENLKKVTASKEELETEVAERQRAEAETAEREQRLRLATDSAELGVFEWDLATGASTWENDWMYELFGLHPGEVAPESRRRFFEDYVHPDDHGLLEGALSAATRPGTMVHTTVRIRRKDDDNWRWIDFLGMTEGGEDGLPTRVVGVARDVTDRKRYEKLDGALNEMRESVTSSFDPKDILRLLAEWGIDALEASSAVLATEKDGVWSVERSFGAAPEVYPHSLAPDERALATAAMTERRPRLEVREQDASAPHPAHGGDSLLAVPVLAAGKPVAVMSYRFRGAREFGSGDRVFANGMMSAVALALDNAHAYQRERTIADTLQEAIVAPAEDIPGLSSGFLYRAASAAANVGGDFYDLFQLDDERVVILVGDVSGKGLQAARLTSLLRDGVRAYAYENPNPGSVLAHLNHLVHRASSPDSFATVFLGVLDLRTGALRYCSAGHPPAAILRPDGVDLLSEAVGTTVVGAFGGVPFPVRDALLGPDDAMVLYTDGVTEARSNGELFGEERLLEALRSLRGVPASDLPEALLEKVLSFSGGELKDDTVILAVSRATG